MARFVVAGLGQDGSVDEFNEFGRVIAVVALAFALAVSVRVFAERLSLPTAALLLVVAAVLSDVFTGLHDALSIADVQRITTVALIVILFDGGMHMGWRKVRASAVPILSTGVLGTFATAALVALAAHVLLDLSWTVSWLIGAALAPTDPAVTFSVLGGREVRGRSGTILEGESGFNDPVGIALMIGMVEYATSDDGSVAGVLGEFALEMAVGLVAGIAGGALMLGVMRRLPLPDVPLYPLRVLALAGLVYGVASVLHGSGFLAVFVAGILIGDAAAPHKGEIERFHSSLASLAEIAAFIALGVTVDLTFIADGGLWADGLLLAALLGFVIRPLAIGGLLLPVRLSWRERGFVMWSGLKGAVPILLASLAVVGGTEYAAEIYGIVFVVVLFSVVVQGTSVPYVASRLHIPMRRVEPLTFEVRTFVVGQETIAEGAAVRSLPLAERAWISEIERDGRQISVSGATTLHPGDQVHVFCEEADAPAVRRIFEGR